MGWLVGWLVGWIWGSLEGVLIGADPIISLLGLFIWNSLYGAPSMGGHIRRPYKEPFVRSPSKESL